jgi:hypothetical protein
VPTRQRAQIGWDFLSGQILTGWAYPPPVGAAIALASGANLTQKARPSDGRCGPCELWVISRHFHRPSRCLLYPRKRTCAVH